jgi:hypothetical protein
VRCSRLGSLSLGFIALTQLVVQACKLIAEAGCLVMKVGCLLPGVGGAFSRSPRLIRRVLSSRLGFRAKLFEEPDSLYKLLALCWIHPVLFPRASTVRNLGGNEITPFLGGRAGNLVRDLTPSNFWRLAT